MLGNVRYCFTFETEGIQSFTKISNLIPSSTELPPVFLMDTRQKVPGLNTDLGIDVFTRSNSTLKEGPSLLIPLMQNMTVALPTNQIKLLQRYCYGVKVAPVLFSAYDVPYLTPVVTSVINFRNEIELVCAIMIKTIISY